MAGPYRPPVPSEDDLKLAKIQSDSAETAKRALKSNGGSGGWGDVSDNPFTKAVKGETGSQREARKAKMYTRQRENLERQVSGGTDASKLDSAKETLQKIQDKLPDAAKSKTLLGAYEKGEPVRKATLGVMETAAGAMMPGVRTIIGGLGNAIAKRGATRAASKLIGEAEGAGTKVAQAASKPGVRRFATDKTKPELVQMRYNQLRNPGGSVRAKPGSAQAGKVTAKNPEPAEAQGPRRPTSVGRRASGNVGSGKDSGYFKDPPVKSESAPSAPAVVSKTRVAAGRAPAGRPAFGEKPANAAYAKPAPKPAAKPKAARVKSTPAKEPPKVSSPASKTLRVTPKGKTLSARPTIGEKPANASFRNVAPKPAAKAPAKSSLQKTLEKSVRQAQAKKAKAA